MSARTGLARGPRWRRLLRHLLADDRALRRRLDTAAMDRLEAAITQAEAGHHGEIRLCIELALPPGAIWARQTPRARALDLFSALRVWDTEHDTGVLIHVLVADRAIELVADRGIARQVPAADWQAIIDALRQALAAGEIEAGLSTAVTAVGARLRRHFPMAEGEAQANELPNRPHLI